MLIFLVITLWFYSKFERRLLSLTTIGIIYNKITHLVLMTRQIENMLTNVNMSLEDEKNA